MKKLFWKEIRQYMSPEEKKNRTLFAARLGINPKTTYEWERGRTIPTPELAREYALRLGLKEGSVEMWRLIRIAQNLAPLPDFKEVHDYLLLMAAAKKKWGHTAKHRKKYRFLDLLHEMLCELNGAEDSIDPNTSYGKLLITKNRVENLT